MVVSEATTDTTEGLTVSVRSASVTVSVPLVLRLRCSQQASVVAAVDADNADHRRILVPVMVMVTVCVIDAAALAVVGLDRVGQRQLLALPPGN